MSRAALAELQIKLDEISMLLTAAENAILKVEKSDAIPVDEEAAALDEFRNLLSRMRVLDSLLVSDIARRTTFDDRVIPLPDGGTVEIRKSTPRKTWDHELLKPVVAEAVLERHIDKETGTIDAPTSQLMAEMLNYVSITSWKITGLKALGIDPNRYCEVGPSKASAQIRHG